MLTGIGGLVPAGVGGAFYALALLAATAGIVLALWEPDWWGPDWFRQRDREFDLSVPINAAIASSARSELGAGSSEAVVRIGNIPSERVLERTCFVREGIKRRYLVHEGALVDATLFSRLRDDA